jgi:hypothetical protein
VPAARSKCFQKSFAARRIVNRRRLTHAQSLLPDRRSHRRSYPTQTGLSIAVTSTWSPFNMTASYFAGCYFHLYVRVLSGFNPHIV